MRTTLHRVVRWLQPFAGGALTIAFVLQTGTASALEVDRIAAVVGPQAITLSEVRRSAEIVNHSTGNELLITDAMLGKELDGLIEREILRQHMRKVGITVADSDVEAALTEMLSHSGMDVTQVDSMLERQGLSKDEYRDRIRAELERRRVVDIEVRPRVVVEDTEIQRYYDEHQGEMSKPARVHIRDLYLPYPPGASADDKGQVQARAKELAATASSGSVSFEELAKRHSKGPGADDGGDLGTFEKGKLRPELEDVAFGLEPGQIGGPVESGGGVHLVQMVEKLAGGPQPLDEMKSDIREKLLTSALERTYKRWYERLLDEAHVERRVQLPSSFDAPITKPALETTPAAPAAPDSPQASGTESPAPPI